MECAHPPSCMASLAMLPVPAARAMEAGLSDVGRGRLGVAGGPVVVATPGLAVAGVEPQTSLTTENGRWDSPQPT